MSIVYFDGFEAGVLTQPPWFDMGGLRISTTRRTGTYGAEGSAEGRGAVMIPDTSRATVGFAFYSQAPANSSAFRFYADNYTVHHIDVTQNAASRLIVRRGTSTVLATSTEAFPQDQWRYIEIQGSIHDTTGQVIVKVDGVEWINYTGDTRNGGTSTDIDAFRVSLVQGFVDDLWIVDNIDDTATTGRPDNSFLGDLKVEPLLPNGNGNVSAWVGSDGNSTDNYLLVDDPTPNTTDYLTSSTSGNRDLWTLGNLSGVTGLVTDIYAVKQATHASKSDAGVSSVKHAWRLSGTTTVDSTPIPLSTTWTSYTSPVRTVKPGGGAWSASDVDALEIGVELD